MLAQAVMLADLVQTLEHGLEIEANILVVVDVLAVACEFIRSDSFDPLCREESLR